MNYYASSTRKTKRAFALPPFLQTSGASPFFDKINKNIFTVGLYFIDRLKISYHREEA